MADKRITDVDFLELLNKNESFFVNQNGSLKQVSSDNAWNIISSSETCTDFISGIGAEIDGTNEAINDMQGEIDGIHTDIDNTNASLDETNDNIKGVAALVSENSTEIDNAVDTIKGVVAALNGFEYVNTINVKDENNDDIIYDMDEEFQQGAHFKFYKTGVAALNTPYKKGIVTLESALILSYVSNTGNYGVQVAFISGGINLYIRALNGGTIGDWHRISATEIS